MDIRAAGFRRTYRVHIPEGYDGTEVPLVVAIHGAFSGAGAFARQSGFSAIADQEGFVVVYPNGIGLFGLLRHWNSGHCCGKALKTGIDDVGFVSTVIDEVTRELRIDPTRVYVVGYSNGGMLTHRIASEGRFPVAAAAAVAATIGGQASADDPEWVIPRPTAPVPILLIHGRADEHVPYEGGRGRGSRGEINTISLSRSVAVWVENNGCVPEPTSTSYLEGRVTREVWGECTNGASVALETIEKWGHNWPGPFFIEKTRGDDSLKGFSAAEVVWDFFKQHRYSVEGTEADGS
jgi:polyhydroxybutyrate depolymerase